MTSDFPADILGLQVAKHGPDARVLTVAGEIDVMTAPELARFLTAQLAAARVVVVDLDGVRFLGSAGLSVLCAAHEAATRDDRQLRLVCNTRIASRALEVTGLRNRFVFAGNVPDALQISR